MLRQQRISTVHRLLLLTGVIITLISMVSPSARARQRDPRNLVHVIGSSHIRADELSTARDEAVSAGLIEAVSRVLNETASADLVIGNFQVLNEKIFSRTDQFINDYKVLAESSNGSTYVVMVQATVAMNRLRHTLDSLGIRAVQKKYARVLFCVAEKGADDAIYSYWWSGDRMGASPGPSIAAEVMGQRLAASGFMVVTPDRSDGFSSYPAELSVSEAAAIGQQMQADVVIVGTSMVQEDTSGADSPTPFFRATVQMRAYRSDNGKLIAQSRQMQTSAAEEPLSNGREALVLAASMAGQELTGQIESAWFSAVAGKSNIEIVVAGTGGNIANFVKLRGALSTMSGVDDVQLTEMRQDAAVLNVDYQGNARALANALLVQDFDNFGIAIGQVGLNTINMQLVQR